MGSRGERDYLRRLGHKVGRKRIQRLMRVMQLVSVVPHKGTSNTAVWYKIYPYLLAESYLSFFPITIGTKNLIGLTTFYQAFA